MSAAANAVALVSLIAAVNVGAMRMLMTFLSASLDQAAVQVSAVNCRELKSTCVCFLLSNRVCTPAPSVNVIMLS